MATDLDLAQARPAASYIRVNAGGKPYVEGHRCTACGAAFFESLMVCPNCGARGSLEAFEAGETGTVVSYTIVARSYPGVAVPFISCIVALDDGVVVKGSLYGVTPAPAATLTGMKVRLSFETVMSKGDKPYLVTRFEPAGNA